MRIHVRRASAWTAVALAAGLAAAACSGGTAASGSGAGAPTGLSAGAGQSALPGLPGSTDTGPVAGADTSAMPGMTMSAPTGASSAAVPVSGDSVTIKSFAFTPAVLSVKAGTKVTWTNQDSDAHTVTSQNNSGPLDSAALATGQSYSFTFTKPGTYAYLCTIHPFMTATVVVTP